jgi:hypothetical protein
MERQMAQPETRPAYHQAMPWTNMIATTITTVTATNPNGRYPQSAECGQRGIAPTNANKSTIRRSDVTLIAPLRQTTSRNL